MKVRKSWGSITSFVSNYWGLILSTLAYTSIALGLFFYKLATIVPAFSTDEISRRNQVASLHAIKTDPFYAPHSLPQFVLQHFHHKGPLAMRSISAIVSIIIVVCFYYVLTKWYTRRIAILGTLLFVSSSWFLHLGRLATIDIMYSAVFILFAGGVWLGQHKTKPAGLMLFALIAVGLLYVPGMLWLIVPLAIWQYRRIGSVISYMSWWQYLLMIVFVLGLLTPLGYAIYKQPSLYKMWLGLPEHWPTLSQAGRNLLHIPSQLLWHGPNDASRWLGRLPLIDWFCAVMFAVGVYAYWFKLHLDRAWLLIYVAIIGTILITIGGPVLMTLFIPFIYLVIASGVALMLQQWFTVFPNNPFARHLGTTLLVLAVFASCLYQTTHYFIAWPHTPETKAAFTQHP